MTTAAVFDTEIRALLDMAKQQGLGDVEVYARRDTGLTLRVNKGELESFQRADSVGVGVRVLLGERVGVSYTENLTEAALARALTSARANAELVEPSPGASLPGPGGLGASGPALYEPGLAAVPLAEKVAFVKALEALTLEADARIKTVPGCAYGDSDTIVRVANTHGLDRRYQANRCYGVVYPLASDGTVNKTFTAMAATRDFSRLDAGALAREAAEGATARLGAREPKSGIYPVVLAGRALADLLASYTSVFSAKAAEEGMSLLAGHEGRQVASTRVQLVDDPFLALGMGARPFDDEGTPSRAFAIIEDGYFAGFLHNAETARRAKKPPTGHGARGGYKGAVGIGPSNLILKAGDATFTDLVAGHEPVIVIDDLQGLHAGTNPISGDFSLQAQGHLYRNGERAHPIHNFTVAGNFLALLEQVEAVGDDLRFFGGSIGVPSVRVSALAIAGA